MFRPFKAKSLTTLKDWKSGTKGSMLARSEKNKNKWNCEVSSSYPQGQDLKSPDPFMEIDLLFVFIHNLLNQWALNILFKWACRDGVETMVNNIWVPLRYWCPSWPLGHMPRLRGWALYGLPYTIQGWARRDLPSPFLTLWPEGEGFRFRTLALWCTFDKSLEGPNDISRFESIKGTQCISTIYSSR